jgi:hypothetical protein
VGPVIGFRFKRVGGVIGKSVTQTLRREYEGDLSLKSAKAMLPRKASMCC